MATTIQAESPSGIPVTLKATADGKLMVDSAVDVTSGAASGKVVTSALFDATAAGTGWANGEVLTRLIVTDTSNNSNTTIWLNASGAAVTGVVIGTNAEAQSERSTVSVASSVLPTNAATSALQTTGNTSLASIDGKIPALASGRSPVVSSVPNVSSGTILGLTTNATGTTYTAFSSQACTALDIVNNTGTTIEYRRGATGTAMQIPTGAARMVIGITNASQVDVRRTDTSNTTVTIQAEAFVL